MSHTHIRRPEPRAGIRTLQMLASACTLIALQSACVAAQSAAVAGDGAANTDGMKVSFIAGERSHGYGSHEHRAGSLLLARLLTEHDENIEAVVHENGWPEDAAALNDTDVVVIFADGGGRHPALPHLDELDRLMDQGVGLVLLHYAVEVPDEAGPRFVEWVGGFFDTHWSVNPHWLMKSLPLPEHPVSRGVVPYEIDDEWYFHMRFRDGMAGVQPILSATAPLTTMERPDGPHSGNPDVRAAVQRGEPQHLAWATERTGGGRGFGFTGAHWHWNWGHPMQRRIVLNAILWAARAEVPAGGVDGGTVTMADLEANQDFEPNQRFDRERWASLVEQWERDF
ncbi:MAG: ThuA domain-containing protein [Gemmatimonadota bacterium]